MMPGHLVAILHSLPTGDGSPTLSRVDAVRRVLDCDSSAVTNLYPAPLANVNGLNRHPGEPTIWDSGRADIRAALSSTVLTDVLLGYGVQVPSGEARELFREQLAWLSRELEPLLVRIWTFGGRPTHPSRWQRVSHRHHPGAPVDEVAAMLLTQASALDIVRWSSQRLPSARLPGDLLFSG